MQSFRAKWSNGLLPIEHLHRIMEVQVTGEAGSSFGVRSKFLVLTFGVFRGTRIMIFWALVLGNVAVDEAVRGSKLREGIEGTIGSLLPPETVDAGSEESSEVGVRNAGWCRVPIDNGGVIDLISKRRGAAGLLLAINRERRK